MCIIGLVVLDGAAAIDALQTQKVEQFKQRIDFDRTLQAENASEAVRAIWPDPVRAPGLGVGWSVAADRIWRTSGGTARQWLLRRLNETVTIAIFVAESGVQPARRFFLVRASENMMVDVPYVSGPAGLGTLAVQNPAKQAAGVIWVYRNIAFHVHARHTSLDILPIVKWLQATAESGLVPAATAAVGLPGPLNVPTRRVAVGQPIDIAVSVPAAAQANYQMELEFIDGAVDLVSQHGLMAQVRGTAAGRAALDLWLIELNTLRSLRSRIDLEFTRSGR